MTQIHQPSGMPLLLMSLFCCFATPVLAQDQVAQGVGGEVEISEDKIWEPEGSLSRRVTVQTDPQLLKNPVAKKKELAPELVYLNQLTARGFAAGLTGVLYDNRDRKHSNLKPARFFPQLTATLYSPNLKARNQDYGLAGEILFSLPTLGNSSTAIKNGPLSRSQSRKAIETDFAARRAHEQYTTNHIYVYPEHRDHDPETGDKFFANTPYTVTSQGSSGSDKDFLRAIAAIIAAMTPSTRQEAERSGRIAPTVQMVLRRTMSGIETQQDYFSGRAHPSAFVGENIDLGRAIALAHSLTPETLPPIVELKVEKDFDARRRLDYLEANRGEAVFTTPSAISRVWRSYAFERDLEVSVSGASEGGLPTTTYHWQILRGDPEKITITPMDNGSIAHIRLQWHDAFPVPGQSDIRTSRVDIGVFADNGETLSAPAIVSVAFPTHQNRKYVKGGDGKMRLASLNYVPNRANYVDPMIWPVALWSDTLNYSDDGQLIGLLREYQTGKSVDYSIGPRSLRFIDAFGKEQENFQTGRTARDGVFWLHDMFSKPE